MSRKLTATNPFYVLLVLVGAAFCVTACAYGVMAFRDVRGGAAVVESDKGGLMAFLDRHGAMLMAAEVGLLAVATVAAMWTDSFWTRRAASLHTKGSPGASAEQQGLEPTAGAAQPPTQPRDQS